MFGCLTRLRIWISWLSSMNSAFRVCSHGREGGWQTCFLKRPAAYLADVPGDFVALFPVEGLVHHLSRDIESAFLKNRNSKSLQPAIRGVYVPYRRPCPGPHSATSSPRQVWIRVSLSTKCFVSAGRESYLDIAAVGADFDGLLRGRLHSCWLVPFFGVASKETSFVALSPNPNERGQSWST